jgi:hypothetical protein
LSGGKGAGGSALGLEISNFGTEDVCTQSPVCAWKGEHGIIRRVRR